MNSRLAVTYLPFKLTFAFQPRYRNFFQTSLSQFNRARVHFDPVTLNFSLTFKVNFFFNFRCYYSLLLALGSLMFYMFGAYDNPQ